MAHGSQGSWLRSHKATIHAMNDIAYRLGFGVILSLGIGLVALRRKSLTPSGVFGAMLVGTLIFGFAGLLSGLLLIAFFVSSSALSHYKKSELRKRQAGEMFDKTSQRDFGQTMANGGFAAFCAVMMMVHHPVWWLPMLGAIATVNADTWATELGTLSRSLPRLITKLDKTVPTGTSGGVTALGTLVAFLGAAFIGLCLLLFTFALLMLLNAFPNEILARLAGIPFYGPMLPPLLAIAGLIGALSDSVLGATVQAIYYSPTRQKETERPFERDGTPNQFLRGWRWMNNDWVNFVSSIIGGLSLWGMVLLVR